MKEELSSFKTSVLTRATWHKIPEDGILHVITTLDYTVSNGWMIMNYRGMWMEALTASFQHIILTYSTMSRENHKILSEQSSVLAKI
jgi:hypothetical protein